MSLAMSVAAQSRLEGSEITAETSTTVASGKFAPLWLSSNRYGLGSVKPVSNYERVSFIRDIRNDSARTWRLGYGADIAIAFGHERTGIVQQAFVEGAWKVLRLTIGAKQQPLETQNPELTSGAMSLGINARPVPQAKLDIDWFNFPGTKGWWQWKMNCSFGIMTDGQWQKTYAAPDTRYAVGTWYHEKSLYWQFGRKDIFPLTYEIGLRMASQFGGTCYNVRHLRANDGRPTNYVHPVNFRAIVDALFCRGSDATDGAYPNVEGNHLGSYIMQLQYHGSRWQARAYWERFFEDHSMLTVQYGIRDMILGAEVSMPDNPFVSTAVLEYLNSCDQSGAVYHDGTHNLPDAIAGRDTYYNHTQYAGWQHYGFAIGNPLLTSPLYNEAIGKAHNIYFYNNRVRALHVALAGDPTPEWHWRLMASFTRNLGTYFQPLDEIRHQKYMMGEATYHPRWAAGWQASLGIGLDHGDLIGNSFGAQLTIRKTWKIKAHETP